MSIRFGLFLVNQFPHGDDMLQRFEDMREQVIEARLAGFHSIWAGQHFLTRPLESFQPMPLLARLLPDAEGMMVGSNILVLPLLNPVAVAEEAVTLDVLSDGRFVLGIGLGYRDEEFEVFAVPKADRVGRMTEGIEVMRRLFTEETVDHHGKYFSVPGQGLGTKPLQAGGPPIWIAASVDRAIERAARIGDAWPITFYPSFTLLTQQMKTYREALTSVGKSVPREMPILRECYIAPTMSEALAESRGPLEGKYALYRAWGQDSFLPQGEQFDQPFEQFTKDRFLIGDAAFIRDEIERYHRALGVNHFILRMQWPGLEHERVLRSIRLMAKEVIPNLAGMQATGS